MKRGRRGERRRQNEAKGGGREGGRRGPTWKRLLPLKVPLSHIGSVWFIAQPAV
jgi:hypothetical protein